MSERLAKRLLIVGWDAADWIIIDALMAKGGMPNLRKVIEKGVRGNLASLEPRLSPLLWSSIATGKTPDQHGILNFVEPDPSGEGLRITSSTSRKTKALWNILTQSGLKTNVVSWYASHPAEPISGVCVSNLFFEGLPYDVKKPWPMPPAAVHPPAWTEAIIEARLHPAEMPGQALLPMIPGLKAEHLAGPRVNMLAKNLAHCVSVHNAATTILTDVGDWDCTMVFYETIDTAGHNFMQYRPPQMDHVSAVDFEMFKDVMDGVYEFHDLMLGTLLDLAGPDTTLILLSDHGFYSDHRRPVIKTQEISADERAAVESRWHRPLGVIALSGPGVKQGERVYGASLLDIAPTALTLLGVPIGADMRGRVLAEAIDRPIQLETVFSWDLMPGEAGMHPADLRQDPFEARNAIQQLIDLGYMSDLPQDAKAQFDLAWRESQCNLATVHASLGQPDRAAAILGEVCQRFPDEPRFQIGFARALHWTGRYAECIAEIEPLLAKSPDDLEALLLLLLALASSGREQEAKQLVLKLDRQHSGQAELSQTFAPVYVQLGLHEEAERHYRRAVDFDSESATMRYGLAEALVRKEHFEEAIDHVLRAIEIMHFYPEAHHLLGIALTWAKDYPHAIQSFRVAISMRPGFLDAHRYLASIHRHLHQVEEAARHREIAVRILNEQGTGVVSIDFLKRNAPLGPQEWARRMGDSRTDEFADLAPGVE